MSKIIFTPLRRETLKLFIFILISIAANNLPSVFNGFIPYDIDIMDASSQIIISFPFFFDKFYTKKHILEKHTKFSKKDKIIFALVILIHFIFITINIIYDDTLLYISTLFNTYNVFMFVSTIAGKYTSNAGYFIHHFIGQIIFFISASINDILSHKFYNEDFIEKKINYDWKHMTIATLDWMSEITVITYKKYLMEYKYMSPYLISFIFGACSFVYVLFLNFFTIFNPNVICFNNACFKFFYLSSENFSNNFFFSISIIISFIFDIAFYTMDLNILFYFTACHVNLSFYFEAVINNIIKAKDSNISFGLWIVLILSIIFLIIGLCIYLEILELNFCELNKNTKRKISERSGNLGGIKAYTIDEEEEDEEDSLRDSAKHSVEIVPGYTVEV